MGSPMQSLETQNLSDLSDASPTSSTKTAMNRSTVEAERQILRLLHGRRTAAHISQIHAHILRHYLHHSNLLLSRLLSLCASVRKMAYAHQIFLHVQNPNILLFNSIFKAYSLAGPRKEPLHLFSLMRHRGIWPDHYSFAPLLKSSSNLPDLNFGRRLHAQVIALGFESHNSIRIGIVEMYVSCGKMGDAILLFDSMPHRDVIVWNLIIRGFCKLGDVDNGFTFFKRMGERSVVSWNSMITGLAHSGRDREALGLFREMWDAGFEPDDATLVIVLPVCARLGALDDGRWIHSYADGRGFLKKVVAVGNSLIDMYSKCGDMESAAKLFNEMPQRSVVSWNSMIMGLAFNGQGEIGVDLFEEMRKKGVEPNEVTFIGVLGCCTHAGLVEKGGELFDSMFKDHHIEPNLEHYGSMVDLFGRNGCVSEAHALIKRMPMRPSAAIWGALLSACRTHRNLDLAEYAAKELVDLEPWNSGNYVLLSNVYADAGRWQDVKKVRVLMKEKSVQKSPGQSVVESKDTVVH